MDFNVTEHKKVIDKVSDSTLQLIFKKLPLVEFWHSSKEEYSQLPEKAIEILSPFPTTYLREAGFSSFALIRQHITTH